MEKSVGPAPAADSCSPKSASPSALADLLGSTPLFDPSLPSNTLLSHSDLDPKH